MYQYVSICLDATNVCLPSTAYTQGAVAPAQWVCAADQDAFVGERCQSNRWSWRIKCSQVAMENSHVSMALSGSVRRGAHHHSKPA
jgi:hypothetical protein